MVAVSPLEKVKQALASFSVKVGDRVVVAVSGGLDSVCLLHLLRKCPSYRLSLHVAHLNHQFRPEADDEARFVAKLARDWGLPFSISEEPVLSFCREKGVSKQLGARTIRYRFLNKVAGQVNAQWIATAHTADDQAETFLMRILRGSGVRGLGGIPSLRDGSIIRPLLRVTRKEVLQELSKDQIPHVEDPSNQQTIYQRNKIRHLLMPVLEAYNPRIREALCREAILLHDEDDFLKQTVMEMLPSLQIKAESDSVTYNIAKLEGLHPALQRRLLLWGLNRLLDGMREIGFRHIEIIRKMFYGKNGSRYKLPGNLTAKKQYANLILERMILANQTSAQEQAKTHILPKMSPFPSKKIVSLPDWEIIMKFSLSTERPTSFSACIASFDFDKISLPLSIRRCQRGDRFVPLGMRGHHKKLQDYFVDAKITRDERERTPLLCCPEGIIWLVGHRIDERFRITNETDRILTVETVQTRCPELAC